MSKVQVDTIDTRSGTSTMQIGSTNTSTINLGVSGDTVNIPSGVTIANAGTATGFGGDNTPSFQAYGNTSYQAVADGTYTTVQMPNELYDTDSAYSTSTYKFTPQTSGKYFFWGHAMGDGNWNTTMFLVIQKNQSFTAGDFWRSNGYVTANGGVTCSGVLTANGSSDYFELRVYQGSGGSLNLRNQPSEIQFGGYKIIE